MCSYAQGYNIIRAKSQEQGWDIDLGALARIWKGGCIIRAGVCKGVPFKRYVGWRDAAGRPLRPHPLFLLVHGVACPIACPGFELPFS